MNYNGKGGKMSDYWYAVRYTDSDDFDLRKSLKNARSKAFEMVMERKKKSVTIEIAPEKGARKVVGHVRYDYTKDRYGDVYGPVYVTKTRNKYLLDYDGAIFTLNDKRVEKKSKGYKW